MKTFNLTCPHCQKEQRLTQTNLWAWYNDHVLGCRAFPTRATGINLVDLARHGLDRIREGLLIKGRILVQLWRDDGQLLDVRLDHNLIVDTGKALVIDRLQGVGGPPAVADYQAIGTGSTAAAAGDTTLGTEVARGQGTLSQPTATTDRLVTTFAAGTGTGAITETGRLNAASSGTLLARQVFSAVNKGASDTLTITHDLTV